MNFYLFLSLSQFLTCENWLQSSEISNKQSTYAIHVKKSTLMYPGMSSQSICVLFVCFSYRTFSLGTKGCLNINTFIWTNVLAKYQGARTSDFDIANKLKEEGVFLWDDPDSDLWSKITRIMANQRIINPCPDRIDFSNLL